MTITPLSKQNPIIADQSDSAQIPLSETAQIDQHENEQALKETLEATDRLAAKLLEQICHLQAENAILKASLYEERKVAGSEIEILEGLLDVKNQALKASEETNSKLQKILSEVEQIHRLCTPKDGLATAKAFIRANEFFKKFNSYQ